MELPKSCKGSMEVHPDFVEKLAQIRGRNHALEQARGSLQQLRTKLQDLQNVNPAPSLRDLVHENTATLLKEAEGRIAELLEERAALRHNLERTRVQAEQEIAELRSVAEAQALQLRMADERMRECVQQSAEVAMLRQQLGDLAESRAGHRRHLEQLQLELQADAALCDRWRLVSPCEVSGRDRLRGSSSYVGGGKDDLPSARAPPLLSVAQITEVLEQQQSAVADVRGKAASRVAGVKRQVSDLDRDISILRSKSRDFDRGLSKIVTSRRISPIKLGKSALSAFIENTLKKRVEVDNLHNSGGYPPFF